MTLHLVVETSILLQNMTPVSLGENPVFVVTYFDSFNIIFHLASGKFSIFTFHQCLTFVSKYVSCSHRTCQRCVCLSTGLQTRTPSLCCYPRDNHYLQHLFCSEILPLLIMTAPDNLLHTLTCFRESGDAFTVF